MFLGHDIYFWISVGAATIVRYLLGEKHSPWQAFITGFAGIWAAWTFTQPFINMVGWDGDTYMISVAGTLALTGSGLARIMITITQDPENLAKFFSDIIKAWRGGQK